jgi:hypothetical protein
VREDRILASLHSILCYAELSNALDPLKNMCRAVPGISHLSHYNIEQTTAEKAAAKKAAAEMAAAEEAAQQKVLLSKMLVP